MDERVIGRQGPIVTEVVEGEPIRVGGRELVPVVRVTTRGRRGATVGPDRLAGQGWGFVRLQPIAILERSESGEDRVPIRDRTAEVLGGLLLAAFIIPLLLGVAVRLARTKRRG
jgi:uncharacterized spore protein YtfJ